MDKNLSSCANDEPVIIDGAKQNGGPKAAVWFVNRRLPLGVAVQISSSHLLYFMLKCKAMTEATLSAKNQIVVPREAREALGLKPGDKILVVVRGEKVLVLQRPKSHRVAMRGMARGIYAADHVQKERRDWR